jgi:hypothetical protein
VTSAMPAGGVDSSSNGQASNGNAANGNAPAAQWLPVFKLGVDPANTSNGVNGDAKSLITGGPATVTGQTVAQSAAMAAALAAPAVNADGGVGPLDVGAPPGNSTMPSGDSGTPTGGAASKATSQAQRQANLNNAYAQLGATNPDSSVP